MWMSWEMKRHEFIALSVGHMRYYITNQNKTTAQFKGTV